MTATTATPPLESPVAPVTATAPGAPPVPPSSPAGPVVSDPRLLIIDGAHDVTVSSTTDTEAEVRAALEGKVPEIATPPAPPVTPPPAAPPPPPAPGPAKTDPPVDASDPAATEAARTLNTRKRTVQQRIGDLTYQANEARRRAEAAEADAAATKAELAALKAGKQPDGTAPPATPKKPELADYQDQPDPYAAHTEALSTWTRDRAREDAERTTAEAIRTARASDADARAQAAAQEGQRAREAAYIARQEAFIAATADYRDRVDAANAAQAARLEAGEAEVILPPALSFAILDSDQGPQIALHLLEHPDLARQLAGYVTVGPMLRHLGRLEAELGRPSSGDPTPPPDPAARARDALASSSSSTAPVSTAPAPPSLVGGSPTVSGATLEDLPQADYNRLMNERDRKRGRR